MTANGTIVLCDDKTVDRADRAALLENAGATVEVLDEKTETAVANAVRGARAIVVDAATPVTERALADTDSLEVVGRAGIGVDNIDVQAAAANDVTVVNVPDYSLDEVSTHAMALLLACIRGVPRYDRAVREGTWDWRTAAPLKRLSGSTVGLVGFGGIARRVATKLQTFGVDVLATDPYVDAALMREYGVRDVSFDGLLERADHVSIHVPLYEDTRSLFSTTEFERLPETAVVVNTARGGVLDERALLCALEADEIAAAGLDVLESEPPAPGDPLVEREDVVLTPHAAWYSEESQRDLSEGVAAAVAAVLRDESPRGVVDPGDPWV
jgi:D-3-phosphoglycerate dehydrogenase